MADKQQLAIARQGSDAWNAWRKQNESVDVDLSGAELSGAELMGAYLNGANLSKVNLCKANLSGAYLFDANLSGANLRGAALGRASLLHTIFEGADLTGCRVYGISAWDLKLDEAVQKNLIITRYDEPEITVDNLELAQFVYLLLKHERLRHVIDTITSKVVLILGRFTEGSLGGVTGRAAPARLHAGAL